MKRALRIALIVLGVLGFTAYFSFATFLFNPLEGGYEPGVATLVPRDVDVFVARADLIDDFDDELVLRRADELAAGPWGNFANEPAFAELRTQYDSVREQVKEQLAQLPLSAHPLSIFGGAEFALAAWFDKPAPGGVEWAVYGRGNWMAKLAFAALEHPSWFGLEAQGFTASSDGEVIALEGGTLEFPLYFSRVRDVLVVSNGRALPSGAREFERNRAENSFGMSARYNDEVRGSGRDGDAEVFVRSDRLPKLLGIDGPLPDPASPEFVEALLGRVVQLASVAELAGAVGLEEEFVSIALEGEWNTAVLTDDQKRIYRRKPADQRDVAKRVGQLAPADSGAVLYFEMDIGDLLRLCVQSAERALVENLESGVVQPIFGYATLDPLIAEIEAAFKDRVAIVVRPNTYTYKGGVDPTNDGRATVAWAIALWIDDPLQLVHPEASKAGILERLQDPRHAARLGLQGANPGEAGIYTNEVAGFKVTEYWSPLVTGTGHIATGLATDVFVVSNHARMIAEIGLTQATQVASLATRPEFNAMMDSGLPSISALLWLDPAKIEETMIELTRQSARDDVFDQMDDVRERGRLEREILTRDFPGEKHGQLSSPEVEARLEELVLEQLQVFRANFSAEHLPALIRERETRITQMSSISRALLQLQFDNEDFSLNTRVVLRPAQ
jgi:hypothetical protein